jgi:hypothetical protein
VTGARPRASAPGATLARLARAKTPPRCRMAHRSGSQCVVKRRTLRSHRTELKNPSWTKQGRKQGARVQVQEEEWLAEVGRTHRDTRVRARVPSPREVVVGVDARDGTIEGESVCRDLSGIFYRTPQRNHRVRESVRGPFTTEGVLGRTNACSSPGVRQAALIHG